MDIKGFKNSHGVSGLSLVYNSTFISNLLLLLIAVMHVSQLNDV